MSADKFGGEVAVTMDMLKDTCVDLLNHQEFISVAKDCHLCGTTFQTGLDSGETICPKCQEMWKEFIKSKGVE